MALRIQSAALTLVLAAAAHAAPTGGAPAGSLLAGYSFDEGEAELATGPDTFSVFRAGGGDVRLSSEFRVSGYRAVEIRDTPGDRDFPELQGYFPLRKDGRLYAHFSFLTTDAAQELNIALAGPQHFRLAKDGIAFWMGVRSGTMFHMSDSIPKKLVPVEPFVWYTVDLDYDIAAGRYDLHVQMEGRAEPLFTLRGQANAANQPGSAVDKFSFVGDVEEDASSVRYYVDDVMIASTRPEPARPFVAPGRRKLFVDSFLELHRKQAARLQCLPVTSTDDLGLDGEEVRALLQAGLYDTLMSALGGRVERATLAQVAEPYRTTMLIAGDWGTGCSALAAGQPKEALAAFERAVAASPNGRLYALSAVQSLIALRRFDEAETRLMMVLGMFSHDARAAVVFAQLGLARGDAPRARAWLQQSAETANAATPGGPAAAEVFYNVLLADGDFPMARLYATRRAELARADNFERARWIERAGDAAYYAGDREEARRAYESAVRVDATRTSPWLKLSDLAFLGGDLATERALRERIYGSLREGP